MVLCVFVMLLNRIRKFKFYVGNFLEKGVCWRIEVFLIDKCYLIYVYCEVLSIWVNLIFIKLYLEVDK